MFRRIAPQDVQFPIQFTDWTAGVLVEWIAADDARCHDERLRAPLEAVLDAGGDGMTTVALTRLLAQRIAADPELRMRPVAPERELTASGA